MVENPDGLRIEELSRRSSVSVRNIREYQDRGLLLPPRREGRVALYDETHVVRLELISRLLTRGYTLAVIRDLLDAWAGGRDLLDVLGLETVVSKPWGGEQPVTYSRQELLDLYDGALDDYIVERLVALGVLAPEGDLLVCPRPSILGAVPDLLAAGIPLASSMDILDRTRVLMDQVAAGFVAFVVEHLLPDDTPQGLPMGGGLVELAESIERLRAVGDIVGAGMFGVAMDQALDDAVDLTRDRALSDVGTLAQDSTR